MVTLNRSASMPASPFSDVLSKLKVFSGRADKDEVSDKALVKIPTLESVTEHQVTAFAEGSSSGGSNSPTSPSSRRWSLRRFRSKDDKKTDLYRTQSDITGTKLTSRDSLEQQSADLIRTALSRTGTNPSQTVEDSKKKKDRPDTAKPTAGALAALGFRAAAVAGPTVQPAPPVEEKEKDKRSSKPNKSFLLPSKPVGSSIKGSEEPRPSRSPSPFFRARKAREARRAREKSPEIHALRKDSTAGAESAAESDGEAVRGRRGAFRPQASAYESPDESDDDVSEKEIKLAVPVVATPVPPAATAAAATVAAPVPTPGPEVKQDEISEDEELHAVGDEHDDDDDFGDDEFDDDFFDEQTKENTEANAIYDAPACEPDSPRDKTKQDRFDVYGEEVEQDVLGEGPNVVVPPEPIFSGPTHVRRTTSKKGLELTTSRPAYGRDRCTINITQGDPDGSLDKSGKRMRRYVVLSDLSDESQYAVEWAVGTVARDGDEIFLISVMEDEGKVDPKAWSSKDASTKIKVQKERQTTASLLARQVTGLLSRTRLNITVTCQALHAKNARHMLLDLIDFLEPTMVIVGSRGLGQLKGILLGSTSHYLVQKSSVPVMVARRRMYRPLRHTSPDKLRHSPRVSLASANIEKTASKRQEDDIVDAADEEEADAAAKAAAAKKQQS